VTHPDQRENPRYSLWSGWPLFSQGFRPFFLLGALWAIGAILIWMHRYAGILEMPTVFDATAWHSHEMIFGYGCAVLCGFLLTAIPNWTGRLPLHGWPLIVLTALWIAGRAVLALPPSLPAAATAAIDLSFLAALLAVAAREIISGRNWRNLPLLLVLAVLLAANAMVHAGQAGWVAGGDAMGIRLALTAFASVIALVGGRIVPSFTRNWMVRMKMSRLPAPFARFDKLALIAMVVAMLSWTASPDHVATGALCLAAAAIHLVRLARWRGWATWHDPLVAVLHLGYVWLPVSLALLGLSALGEGLMLPTAGIHALTAGAIGTMTLAVMSRAIPGHTGGALRAGPLSTAVFAFVTAAAIVRVATAWFPEAQITLLMVSASLWELAFLGFLAVHARALLRARR